MELKLFCNCVYYKPDPPFNRTIVELKPKTLNSVPGRTAPFNRPIVELKYMFPSVVAYLHPSFNRTNVELQLPDGILLFVNIAF